MAGFNFTATSGGGRFAMQRTSIFSDGLVFTVTGFKTGTWNQQQESKNRNSIMLETSLSDKVEDSISLTRFLNRKVVVYDNNGRARIEHQCIFHEELIKFLEDKVGRDSNDSSVLNGTAAEIADKVVREFFGQRKIKCSELKDIFFKVVQDGSEKLVPPIFPIIVFDWA